MALAELDDDNVWINFINEFIEKLVSYFNNEQADLIERMFVFIHVKYIQEDKINSYTRFFKTDHFIDLQRLNNISTQEIIEFFEKKVLKISDDESEENIDKREQLNKIQKAFTTINEKAEFTYYGALKILNINV